ncbi:hypothetical protein HDU78_005084 [Chytriomyces hyalinus]|nr:hypothetical protein HDU78_005084 [Chytriomyces hyalinus]
MDLSQLQARRSSVHQPMEERHAIRQHGMRQRHPHRSDVQPTQALNPSLKPLSNQASSHPPRTTRTNPQMVPIDTTPTLSAQEPALSQVLVEALVSLALALAADTPRPPAINDPFYVAHESDAFHVPDSQREIAYLRLRLWLISLHRTYMLALDALNTPVEWAQITWALLSLSFSIAVLLGVRAMHWLNKASLPVSRCRKAASMDSAVSLSPIHAQQRNLPNSKPHSLVFLLLTNNNEATISHTCSHILSAYKSLAASVPSLTLRLTIVDSKSTDATCAIAARVLSSSRIPVTFNLMRAKDPASWSSKIIQGLSGDTSSLVFILNAEIGETCRIDHLIQKAYSQFELSTSQSGCIGFMPSVFQAEPLSSTTPVVLPPILYKAATFMHFPMHACHLNFMFGYASDVECATKHVKDKEKAVPSHDWKTVADGVEEAGLSWSVGLK